MFHKHQEKGSVVTGLIIAVSVLSLLVNSAVPIAGNLNGTNGVQSENPGEIPPQYPSGPSVNPSTSNANDGNDYLITIDTINGSPANATPAVYINPISLTGYAAVSSFSGQLDQYEYHVQINWGDGNTDPDSWTDFQLDPPGKNFNGTWMSDPSHTYTNPGTYNITATLYHQRFAGAEKYEVSYGNITIDIVNPGNLTVTKEIDWNGFTPEDPGQSFEISLSGPSYSDGNAKTFNAANLVQTWTDLIPGDYTLAEVDPGDQWTVTSLTQDITIAPGQNATAIIRNEHDPMPGSLIVNTTVDWGAVIPDPSQTFTITVNGRGQTVGYQGGNLTWNNLAPGEYNVTETNPGNEWLIDRIEQTATVGSNSVTVVYITNTLVPPPYGNLTVTKTFPEGFSPDPSETFLITVNDETKEFTVDNLTQTWYNLPVGNYDITESAISGWTPANNPQTVTVSESETTCVEFRNNPSWPCGNITVNKSFVGGEPGPGQVFNITVQSDIYSVTKSFDAGHSTFTWSGLPTGEYSVFEAPVADWTPSIDDPTPEVSAGGTTVVNVTNTCSPAPTTGNLTVNKTIVWNGREPDPSLNFNITITDSLKSFSSSRYFNSTVTEQTWENLAPGDYSVTEEDTEENWTVSGNEEPFTVVAGSTTTAYLTNTYTPVQTTGNLTVIKTVEWNGADDSQTFDISITGPSYPNGNSATFGKLNLSHTWSDLAPGNYTVTENNIGAGWSFSGNEHPFTVIAGSTATAYLTNAYTPTPTTGNITVTKIVNWGETTPDQSKRFSITVAGETREFDYDGGNLTWDNLAPGNYTVSEETPGNNWAISGNNQVVTVSAGTTTEATLTNTYCQSQAGSLTATKEIDWNGFTPEDPDRSFEITLTGPSYPGGNTKTFNETDPEQTWTNLIPETYILSETEINGWTATGLGEIEISAGPNSSTITNTHSAPAPGSLTVIKAVDWSGTTPDAGQEFAVKINGTTYPFGDTQTVGYQGGNLTWESLSPGLYTVTELNPGADWSIGYSQQEVEVVSGETAVVTVTNTHVAAGNLTVTKTVDWGNISPDSSKSFVITLTGPSYPAGNNATVRYLGGNVTWTNLHPGLYTITEAGSGSGWTSDAPKDVNVPSGGDATASVTNTAPAPPLGRITVYKEFDGGIPGDSETFRITLNGEEKAFSYVNDNRTWYNLPAGEYTITEAPVAGWTVFQPQNVTLAVGEMKSVTVTNTYNPAPTTGNLTVTKAVDWNGTTPDQSKEFSITVNGQTKTTDYDGGTLTWADLAPGNYIITEEDPGDNWTINGNGQSVTVTAGQTTAASITNTCNAVPAVGSLTVTKAIDWNGFTPNPSQTFNITLTGPSCPGGSSKTFSTSQPVQVWRNLDPGTYALTEMPISGWTVSGTGEIVIAAGQNSATVTSRHAPAPQYGSLTLTKQVDWNGASPDPSRNFTVTLSGPSYPGGAEFTFHYNGGQITLNNLLTGTYTAVETDPGDNWTVTVTGSPVVTANGQATVTVANRYTPDPPGALTLTKTVNWNIAVPETARTFAVTLSGPSFPNGITRYFGYQGGSVTLDNLIPGNYTVSETSPGEGWTVTGSSQVVQVVSGSTTCATVTNDCNYGKITVTKAFIGFTPDAAQTFNIAVAGQAKSFNSGDRVHTWDNLLPGAYTVTEDDVTGWVPVEPQTVQVAAGCPVNFTLTNTAIPSIRVKVNVDWNGFTPDPAKKYYVTATGPAPSGFQAMAVSYPDGNTQSVGYLGGELNWYDLNEGNYTVSQTDSGNGWVGGSPQTVKVVNGFTASATITNTVGLMIAPRAGSLKQNQNGTFTVTARDENGQPSAGQTISLSASSGLLSRSEVTTDANGAAAFTVFSSATGTATITATWIAGENVPLVDRATMTWTSDGGGPGPGPAQTGKLAVTSEFNWNGFTPNPAQTFAVRVTGPSFPSGSVKNFSLNHSYDYWTCLPGTYTITQAASKEWATTISPEVVTVKQLQTANVTVTNERYIPLPSTLQVTPEKSSSDLTKNPSEQFSVVLRDQLDYPLANQNITVSTLFIDAKSNEKFTETLYLITDRNGQAAFGFTADRSGTFTASASIGGLTATAYKSWYRPGNLRVSVDVDWGDKDERENQTFSVIVYGPFYAARSGLYLMPLSYSVSLPGNRLSKSNTFTRPNGYKADGVDYDIFYPSGNIQVYSQVVGHQGGDLLWEKLAPGYYFIYESNPGNWQILKTQSPVYVPADGQADVGVINRPGPSGSLTVKSQINWNGVSPEPGQTFTVTVTGPSLSNGDSYVFSSENPTYTWNNLIPGTYNVVEVDPGDGWKVDITGAPAAVVDNGESTVTVTNGVLPGWLTVNNFVDWGNAVPDTKQTFAITLTGPSHPDGLTLTAGYDGGNLDWINLIPGTYALEAAYPGQGWNVAGGRQEITVPAGKGTLTQVTNTYAVQTLTLTPQTSLSKLPDSADLTLTATVKDSTGNGVPGIVISIETVIETGGTKQYSDQQVTTGDDGTASFTVSSTEEATATVTVAAGDLRAIASNRWYKPGTLRVNGVVDWNNYPVDTAQTFNVAITGPSYPAGSAKTFGWQGETLTWKDLIPGEYTVTEANPGEWQVTISASPVNVPGDGETDAAVTNKHAAPGAARVTKTVDWKGVEIESGRIFELTLTGPSYPGGNTRAVPYNGGIILWENLVPGDYSVSEVGPGAEWTSIIERQMLSVRSGETVASRVSNTHKLGSLRVTKVINWNGMPVIQGQTFAIAITGPSYPDGDTRIFSLSSNVQTWDNLIPGAYSVNEEAVPGWDAYGAGEAAVKAGELTQTTITNTHQRLSIFPKTASGQLPNGRVQTFTVSVLDASGQPVSGQTVSIQTDFGTLSSNRVTTGPDGTASFAVDSEQPGAASVKAAVSGIGDAAATATYLAPGRITAANTAVWSGITPDPNKTFNVTVTGPSYREVKTFSAGSVIQSWENLMPGVYTVTEESPGSGWVVSVSPQTFTVATDRTVNVKITNVLKQLSISPATATGQLPGDKVRIFRVLLMDPAGKPVADQPVTLAASYGVLSTNEVTTGADGAASFYILSEEPGTTTVTASSSELTASATVTWLGPGSLSVTKQIDWAGGIPDENRTFNIVLKGPSYLNGDTKSIVDNATVTWDNLMPGVYTLAEQPVTGWIPSGTGPVTVQAEKTTTVRITNTLKQLSLSPLSATNQLPDEKSRTFTVTVVDPSGKPLSGQTVNIAADLGDLNKNQAVTDNNGAATFDLSINTVPETRQTANITVTFGQLAEQATLTWLPAGRLSVTKIIDWNDAPPDPNQAFSINISGPSGTESRIFNAANLTQVWENLMPGNYTVSEADPGDWQVIVPQSLVAVTSGRKTNAMVINTFAKPGNLTVTKLINWADQKPEPEETFVITLIGPSYPAGSRHTFSSSNPTYTWKNLVPGVYQLFEVQESGNWLVDINGTLKVTPGEAVKATVTNTRAIPEVTPTPTPTPVKTGGGRYLVVDFIGKTNVAAMATDGKLTEPVNATNGSLPHALVIEEGTVAVAEKNEIVSEIDVTEVAKMPPVYDRVIIGKAYDFGPGRIRFSRPVTITLGYNVNDVPEDSAVTIAYYTEEEGWIEVESENIVMGDQGLLTARVTHFTVFAVSVMEHATTMELLRRYLWLVILFLIILIIIIWWLLKKYVFPKEEEA